MGYLTLMSKPGDEVVITTPEGREIVVALFRLDRNRARIGYKAEKCVTIDRRKIHERKKAEAPNAA